YRFRQLDGGTYFVQQDLPLGWIETDPAAASADPVVKPADTGPAPRERNDTLATAIATGLNSATPATYIAQGVIGDNKHVAPTLDVDMYRFQLSAGDMARIDIDAFAFASPLDSVLRVFDATGVQVTGNDEPVAGVGDAHLEFVAKTTGTYYVGVSGLANGQYDPAVEGSGDSN